MFKTKGLLTLREKLTSRDKVRPVKAFLFSFCSLFFLICDLNFLVRSEDLERLFSQYGRLTDAHIPLDHYTGEPRDFAYVQYPFLYLKSVILSVVSISLSLLRFGTKMTFLSFDNQGKRVGRRAKVTRKRLGKSIKILKLKLAQRGNESS